MQELPIPLSAQPIYKLYSNLPMFTLYGPHVIPHISQKNPIPILNVHLTFFKHNSISLTPYNPKQRKKMSLYSKFRILIIIFLYSIYNIMFLVKRTISEVECWSIVKILLLLILQIFFLFMVTLLLSWSILQSLYMFYILPSRKSLV